MLFILFIFGLIVGSFLNVVILRLPEGETLGGRSHCPGCGHELAAWELVPLFSFLYLQGKCSSCKRKISPRYFIIELVTGVLFLLAGILLGKEGLSNPVLLLRAITASAILLVVFVVDLEQYIILDRVLIAGIVLLLSLNIVSDIAYPVHMGIVHGFAISGIIAGIAGSVPFFALWYFSGGKWMGFGDVKLVLFLGLVVGWPLIWVNLFLSFFMGAAYSIIPLLAGSKTLNSKVPFGTFLSLACLTTLYFGPSLVNWYLHLIGWG
jgi:leader peptidase (prepilin peptidase)/N-methyltransferase